MTDRPSRLWAAVVVALLLAGCGAPAASVAPTPDAPSAAPSTAPSPETQILLGTVAVAGEALQGGFGGCDAPGYEDVADGANVVVKDERDTTIGSATLKMLTGPEQSTPCRFAFSVVVPKASFYRVSIGGRAGPTVSYDDLVKSNWRWELSLGL